MHSHAIYFDDWHGASCGYEVSEEDVDSRLRVALKEFKPTLSESLYNVWKLVGCGESPLEEMEEGKYIISDLHPPVEVCMQHDDNGLDWVVTTVGQHEVRSTLVQFCRWVVSLASLGTKLPQGLTITGTRALEDFALRYTVDRNPSDSDSPETVPEAPRETRIPAMPMRAPPPLSLAPVSSKAGVRKAAVPMARIENRSRTRSRSTRRKRRSRRSSRRRRRTRSECSRARSARTRNPSSSRRRPPPPPSFTKVGADEMMVRAPVMSKAAAKQRPLALKPKPPPVKAKAATKKEARVEFDDNDF